MKGVGRDFELCIRPKAARIELGRSNLHFGEYFRALCAPLFP